MCIDDRYIYTFVIDFKKGRGSQLDYFFLCFRHLLLDFDDSCFVGYLSSGLINLYLEFEESIVPLRMANPKTNTIL